MSKLVSDELWEIVEPFLPAPKPRRFRYPGRKPTENRVALSAIIFVLKTGIPWEDVPDEMGCSGMTAWTRLHEWQEAGIWEKIPVAILQKLEDKDKLDWEHGIVDSSSVRAAIGGEKTGPNPTDRAKPGTKHHALSEGNGLPLSTTVTQANRNDITQTSHNWSLWSRRCPKSKMKTENRSSLRLSWPTALTILNRIETG